MPERIVRPGILTSERVNQLKFPAEVFYRRLMSVVDDFGRYDGRPQILRTQLYPLLIDRVTTRNIEQWITECVTASLITEYCDGEGRPFIEINDFNQRLRAKKSKWPAPADICMQMHADACECNGDGDGDGVGDDNPPNPLSKKGDPPGTFKIDLSPERFPFLDDSEFKRDWEEYLKSRKKKATDRAKELSLVKLHKFPIPTALKMLQRAIEGGWTGIFELKEEPKNRNGNIPRYTPPKVSQDELPSSEDWGDINQMKKEAGIA